MYNPWIVVLQLLVLAVLAVFCCSEDSKLLQVFLITRLTASTWLEASKVKHESIECVTSFFFFFNNHVLSEADKLQIVFKGWLKY